LNQSGRSTYSRRSENVQFVGYFLYDLPFYITVQTFLESTKYVLRKLKL